ncbi:MAG: DUF3536 domain-containing protein [Gemmatimonadales bacterium]
MSAARSVVIHGHFYQPPRENPWTGVVEREDNAAPDHDWNARITRECYAPLAAIPIGGGPTAEQPTLNAYQYTSFDVGPTLASWLEVEAPDVLAAMLAGDADSRERLGHGNAIAMPYHHVILPLCSHRDKTTEVRWGLEDFRRTFGREATGMWLPETAVDNDTLDVLAAEGVAFTVLAPHQVAAPPAAGFPGTYKASGGRSIAVFTYDGAASHAVAFGRMLEDAVEWERALLGNPARTVVSLATDGETFGHHHRFGDLALGALIDHLLARRDVTVTNFAAVLAERKPVESVELVAPSSWSCVHGVERWRSECGCRVKAGTQQRWRAPLREAIDWLVGEIHAIYDRRGAALIEMEKSALASMTSCGWFFDDFAGLEGRQVLRYAARAIALAGSDGPHLEAGLLSRLKKAISNDPEAGSAAAFYRRDVLPKAPA